jgi:hypothetical protein
MSAIMAILANFFARTPGFFKLHCKQMRFFQSTLGSRLRDPCVTLA